MVTMMLSSCPCLLTEKLREVSSSVAFLNMFRISLREGWMFRSFSENNHEILRVCHMIQKSFAYAGGVHWVHVYPPPPGKEVPLRNVQKRRESSAQICRQKRMCTFHSDTAKLKRKR